MTTDNEINPNGYAVVYFGTDADPLTPRVCKGLDNGTRIGGTNYAIFDTVEDAVEEFRRWPVYSGGYPAQYGILPAHIVLEEVPRYTLKESAR